MEEGISEEPQPSSQIQKTTIEYLDEMCSYYMLIGMTYDEYWHSGLERWAMYDRRHQMAVESRNQEMWLQGVYVMQAFQCVLGQAFGHSDIKYPDKPHRITPLTEDEKAIEDAKNKAQLKAYFESLAATINKKGKRKQEQLKADELNGN